MSRYRKEHHGTSVLEAIETLSDLADLDLEQEKNVEIPTPDLNVTPEGGVERTIEWLHKADQDAQVHTIKNLFNVILTYLKKNYQQEASYITSEKVNDGIESIMVVVGEAAKKFDRLVSLRKGTCKVSVTELEEYKQLQKFYLKRIERQIDQKVLGRWILGLTQATILPKRPKEVSLRKRVTSNHVFMDLDTVKKDTEYELLLLRKEDGSRFFNPKLLKNIKLICDFGEGLAADKHGDPLQKVKLWQDRLAHASARELLDSIGLFVDRYFHHAIKRKDKDFVGLLKKALMALMLAANPKHLFENEPRKCCFEYFSDFQFYLRHTLMTPDYQKWLTYPPKAHNRYANSLLELTHAMCQSLFQNLRGVQEMLYQVDDLIHQARDEMKGKSAEFLSDRLAFNYQAMQKLLKHHSKGPLVKVIELLEESGYPTFDSLVQKNIPNHWFTLYPEGERVAHLRIPSPTHQRVIQEALVTGEFKGFLHGYGRRGAKRRHLLINLQDRTSWKGHARAKALEKLQGAQAFEKHLSVVTLGMDTDFYHQLNDYAGSLSTNDFIEQFYEHLNGEASGYLFPAELRQEIFPKYIQKSMALIHETFFHDQKEMSPADKRSFITLFHGLLVLKCIDFYKPESFSLTCKDGVDTGSVFSGFLFAFLKLINRKNLSEFDLEYMHLMLFGPAIAIRERLVLPADFHRLVEALKVVEKVQKKIGKDKFKDHIQKKLSSLFHMPILSSRIGLPSLDTTHQ